MSALTLPLRVTEYALTLGFPLLVLVITFTLYPVDYGEVSLFANESLQRTGYISTLVVASGYSGWQAGYGVVEDVEVMESERAYMLKVRVGEDVVKIAVFKLNVEDEGSLDLKSLKGLKVTFYGPQISIRGEKVTLARVLVIEAPHMHGKHHTMCMYKDDFHKKCSEMMEKHREMMEKHGRND